MADLRLIKRDTILPPLRHMDWDVVINGIPHYVVRIEGYVHTIGGRYGENDLWAYPRDKAPSYDTLVEFGCDCPVAWGIRCFLFDEDTRKNKLYALLIIGATLPIAFLEGDVITTIIISLIALPMFFAKENWIL